MKKSAIAGAALFAGFALAAPLSAYSQAQPQTAPEQQQNRGTAGDRMGTPGMGPQGMGMMGMGMMGAGMRGDNDEDEGMGWRRRWMQEQMHRRMHDRSGFGGMGGGMARRSPAVELDVFPGQLHTFQMCAGRSPVADDAIARAGAWLRRTLAS